MNIMRKRISLILGIIMLALAIIPVVNVSAAEECQVTMSATMGSKTLQNNGKYNVQGGEKIVIKAESTEADIAFIAYYFSTQKFEDRTKIYKNTATITVPQGKAGTSINLYVEPVASNDNGSANTTTKTGWQKYVLVYPAAPSVDKDLEVSYNNKVLSVNSTNIIEAGKTIYASAKPANNVSKIYYKWETGTMQTVNGADAKISVPAGLEAGKTYKLLVNAIYTDDLYVDGRDGATTKSEAYYFTMPEDKVDIKDRELDIEPWMEENDEIGELTVSLRNDSEVEEKANKNIYELNETVTYYIDYKNGGKDINGDVSIVLELPLDFEVISADGGEISDDEIEWVFDGMEEGEAGTIVVKVQYTDLKKSKDDANTIYPSASIAKGSKVKDVSTVVNMIITEYDEELDIDHEPYMFGDANADTFRPDYLITRAEGALVLARIFGLDYKNVKTITTKYPDINETYEEAQKAITAASEAGLINGYPEKDGTYTYRPNEKMTKAEFMKILARMVQEFGNDKDIEGLQVKDLDKLIKNYDDAKRYYIAEGKRVNMHWAIPEITLLARLNMLPLGENYDEFELDENITRAEVAQLINFYLLRAPADVTSKTKTGFSDVSRKHDLVGDIIEATRESHTFSITTDVTEVEE